MNTSISSTGVNHLAISTRDIKSQIAYLTDVLGCPVRALYRMHGAKGAWHAFVELNPASYIAFVFHPDNPDTQAASAHEGAELLEHDYASYLSPNRSCALGIQSNTGKPFHSVTLDLEHAARPEPLSSATVTSIHRRRRQR